MVYHAPDELPAGAHAALTARLLETGADPNAWRVEFVWSAGDDRGAYAVALEGEGQSRGFNVFVKDGSWTVFEVEE